MKTRIIGSILVVVVLVTLYLLTADGNVQHNTQGQFAPQANENAFKDLKIN